MEFQQIKYFREITQTGSISKAAEKLYISQPSLSQVLKRLEEEIGVPLFDRNGKKIILNGAGKIFLKYCDEIICSLENAKRELDEYKGNEIADINIAVESASLLIPDIIKRISCFPQIKPHIFQSGCTDWDLRLYSDYSSTGSTLLLKEPIGVVIPTNNPLAEKKVITKDLLSNCSFISLSSECNLYKIISHFCKNANFTQNISTFVDSPSLMRELLKMNLGIAFVPQYTWYSFYKDCLAFKTIDDMPMSRCVWLAVNERKYTTSAVKQSCDAIEEYFAEYHRKFQ